MKVLELEELICSMLERLEPDAEVFVEDEDGFLHDFKIERKEMTFDGFDTVSPEGLKIVLID